MKDSYDPRTQWRTKLGALLNISDMSTSHIKNCLRLLEKKGFVSSRTVAFYITTPGPDGEAAQDCFERECRHVFDAPIHPSMSALERELEKRGELV